MSAAVAISGAGRAAPGDALTCAGAAVRAALTDAGTTVRDVDGLLSCGTDGPSVADLFGFELDWRAGVHEADEVGAAVVQAVDAVAAGRVRTLVCVDVVGIPDPPPGADRFGVETASGWASWHAPYGAVDATVDVALQVRAYIERFGLTRAELARIPLVAAANAGRDLSLRDYLSAPPLADPLCVHDRARTVGGAAAVVLRPAAAAGSRSVEVARRGAAYAVSPLPEQSAVPAPERAAAQLLADLGGLPPGVLLIGDEYSFRVVTWLEALRLCGPGEAGTVLASADTITRGGALPLNPHGGHLGLGRRPDLDLAVEAVLQMRADAGTSQLDVPPESSVVALGGTLSAGCLLLRRSG
ncbi:thiolase C-terminal domain-containing protein [Rhodococcus gannanensis]|uniref:Thiolase C-terminal domain-containing protein n=1 Tax=Rhodococcus gannanensis TaxID=1960308 RepID=A0ABW4PB59_9NOCA